ncbi:HEAT repeat domain-containing protein [Pandoraea sp. NPDC090278]|uniref:HEAT repeat domain-containing protein n=1 Tax=Pandoraea sp. NPDC090278 TaxID=3364391 RepID=UPI00383A4E53
MTIDSTPEIKEALTLNELLALLRHAPTIRQVAQGIYDENGIHEVARWLAAYASNRSSVIDCICHELDYPKNFQQHNDVQPPTFIVHSDERIVIRLVVWLPRSGRFGNTPFSYEEPHDHNFDFWTVNFFGDGYVTHLYDYSYDEVTGFSDEAVALDYRGEHVLCPGKVMFYVRNKDLHIQHPPKNLSASLNLIVQPEVASRQYEFRLDATRAQGRTNAYIKKGRFERYKTQETLFHGLLNFGNQESRRKVLNIAQHHGKSEIRAVAFEALLAYAQRVGDFASAKHVVALIDDDPDTYVKNRVARHIGTLPGLGPDSVAAMCGSNPFGSTIGELS